MKLLVCLFWLLTAASGQVQVETRNENRRSQGYRQLSERGARYGIHIENSLSPGDCDCEWSEGDCGCRCFGSLSRDYLDKLSLTFQPCRRFYFLLSDGTLHSLPRDFFSPVGEVDEFTLEMSNVIADYFLDPAPNTSPFRGVSFRYKASIHLSDVRVIVGWNWTPLRELTSSLGFGLNITVDGSGLNMLPSDFSRVAEGSVKSVSISNSNLQLLGRGAFESFDNVTHVLLPDNKIRSIRRSVLPKQALMLEEIDLRKNELRSLDPDIFAAMPNLKIVALNGNPLREVGQEPFGPIFQSARIDGLSDLPLVCDCKLRWLKEVPENENVRQLNKAHCRKPPHLRGKPIKHLSAEHMICR